MANTTTNYGLFKPEGTDPYNHLIYDNPNMDTIDAAMKANSDASVNRATCVKTGTNHAVLRSNTDANVFEFTATGDWITGDTMTVDGVSVSVYLPDGSAPTSGVYVINTEVLAIIQGTRVTLYAGTKETAAETSYDNTVSGLVATNVQAAIDEVNADIPHSLDSLNGGHFNNVNIGAGDRILDFITNTTYGIGVYALRCGSADDLPTSSTTAFCIVYKHNNNGLYARAYCFISAHIYYAGIGGTLPSDLTWTTII